VNLTDRVAVPTHVMARQVGEDCVMLDLANGTYFGLDAIGARVWRLLGEGRSLQEVCDALVAEYDVTAAQAEADVTSLVAELAAHGLVDAA
jgi:hypothetical protein